MADPLLDAAIAAETEVQAADGALSSAATTLRGAEELLDALLAAPGVTRAEREAAILDADEKRGLWLSAAATRAERHAACQAAYVAHCDSLSVDTLRPYKVLPEGLVRMSAEEHDKAIAAQAADRAKAERDRADAEAAERARLESVVATAVAAEFAKRGQ
ncbi:MAG TPA: hypothetical protein VJ890_21240 [Vineibacter sp.]|nr:hypothetical protein [Vineibacter sp.]